MKLVYKVALAASVVAMSAGCTSGAVAPPEPAPVGTPYYQSGQPLPGGYYAYKISAGPWGAEQYYFCDYAVRGSCVGHSETTYYGTLPKQVWRAANLTYSATDGWSAVESGGWYYFP